MSRDSVVETPETDEIRREIFNLRTLRDLTLTEVAQMLGVAQGWLSKFMSGSKPSDEMIRKLKDSINILKQAPLPPKTAKSIMRHLETLRADNKPRIKDALDYFDKEDISACVFIEGDLIGVVSEDKIRPQSTIDPTVYKPIDFMDISHELIAIDSYTPYTEVRRLFGAIASLDAVVVMEKLQENEERDERETERKGFLYKPIGIITKDEAFWAGIGFSGNPSRRFWKRNAETYVKQELPRKAAEVLSERVLHTITDKPELITVLDLGTGPGNFAIAFLKKAKEMLPNTELDILAIDQPIPEFEKAALERFKDYPMIQPNFGGLHQLKGMTKKFDVVGFNMVHPVRSTLTYPGLPEPQEYWEDAINALKDDCGKVAISYYDRETLDKLFKEIEKIFADFDRYFWRQIAQLYSLEQLKNELEAKGLVVIDYMPHNIEVESLKNGRAMLEYLTCSMPAVDFSFISIPKDKKFSKLRKAVEETLDDALKKETIQIQVNTAVAVKKS